MTAYILRDGLPLYFHGHGPFGIGKQYAYPGYSAVVLIIRGNPAVGPLDIT
jgi:hypothetical protein